MSKQDNGFTYQDSVTLKEFFLAKLEAQDKTTELTRLSLERRLESMNAFREQINKIEGTFVTRKELIAWVISAIGIIISIIMIFK